MTDLSPAAQAVLDAAFPVYDEEEHLYVATGEQHAGMIAAAALRAAADLINGVPDDWELMSASFWAGRASAATKLLSIAAEMGGTQPPSENV